jgi:hypothetical protein
MKRLCQQPTAATHLAVVTVLLRRYVVTSFALLLLASTVLCSVCHATTFVSGNVSGTWVKSGSPYAATGNCTVPSGQTLVIQPGVTVIIGQNLRMYVLGQILAIGSPSERIIIRGATPSLYWDTIAIQNGGGADSRFVNCSISDSINGLFLQNTVTSSTMAPEISTCLFSNCVSSCIHGDVASAFDHADLNAMIVACRFQAAGTGIHLRILPGCCGGHGTASPTIVNNLFSMISGTAIWLENDPSGFSSRPILDNNIFQQCATAVVKSGAYPTFYDEVSYNCFYNNQTNFVGYPAGVYGVICCQNNNGTPCDLAYNIFQNPLFAETTNYTLSAGSPCIDAGNPIGEYLDGCFPPSQGTTANDIGLYGGPYACSWIASTNTAFDLGIRLYAGVTIIPGVPGHYRIEYTGDLVAGPWLQATNLTLGTTPFTYIDLDSPDVHQRFYRGVLLP